MICLFVSNDLHKDYIWRSSCSLDQQEIVGFFYELFINDSSYLDHIDDLSNLNDICIESRLVH